MNSVIFVMIVIVVLASIQVVDFVIKHNLKVYQALILILIYVATSCYFIFKILDLLGI